MWGSEIVDRFKEKRDKRCRVTDGRAKRTDEECQRTLLLCVHTRKHKRLGTVIDSFYFLLSDCDAERLENKENREAPSKTTHLPSNDSHFILSNFARSTRRKSFIDDDQE